MLYWKKEAKVRGYNVIPQVNCPDQSECRCLCHWWAQTVNIMKRIPTEMCISHQEEVSLWNLTGGEVLLEEKSVNVSESWRKPGTEEKRSFLFSSSRFVIEFLKSGNGLLHFIFARHTLVTSWATNGWTDEMFSLPILTGINITNQIEKWITYKSCRIQNAGNAIN